MHELGNITTVICWKVLFHVHDECLCLSLVPQYLGMSPRHYSQQIQPDLRVWTNDVMFTQRDFFMNVYYGDVFLLGCCCRVLVLWRWSLPLFVVICSSINVCVVLIATTITSLCLESCVGDYSVHRWWLLYLWCLRFSCVFMWADNKHFYRMNCTMWDNLCCASSTTD